jgi:hypothetical protein
VIGVVTLAEQPIAGPVPALLAPRAQRVHLLLAEQEAAYPLGLALVSVDDPADGLGLRSRCVQARLLGTRRTRGARGTRRGQLLALLVTRVHAADGNDRGAGEAGGDESTQR